MIVLEGKSVYKGIAIGSMKYYKKAEIDEKVYQISDTEAEQNRFEIGRQKAMEQLEELYKKALQEIGSEEAMILQAHQLLLQDTEYLSYIKKIITEQRYNAEYAVRSASDYFAEIFSSMEDDYMKERAADIKDISERLIRTLGEEKTEFKLTEPAVIAAEDLAPSETVQLDRSKILSLVTQRGSVNSHTAILARTMNIPAIIGVGEMLKPEYDGCQVIVDGFSGKIYLDPEEDLLLEYKEKQRVEEERRAMLTDLLGKENRTRDGKQIDIFANIGEPQDVREALKNDAGGVGLMRSEFLYLNKKSFPSEEEQLAAYKEVLKGMEGRKVIIRTLDIGADKQAEYFQLPKEENPALGYRAIRICLTRKEIFRTQLRALYRASVYGNLGIMFPMIISVEEIREIKQILSEVKQELSRDGIAYSDKIELGIMIETPAAAVISDLLAKEVDFFSIGTNDLTQYTTAIDRQNPMLASFQDPHHPAVLRLIKLTVENAHNNGIWVGICGELAADTTMTETFLEYGVDELSVAPGMILELRKTVREL
jgi:phosphotransferase system enzyme I (PtsI)